MSFIAGIGNTPRKNIARLNADGSLDTSFDPVVDSTVSAVFLQPDGKILIGGAFGTVDGVTRGQIARLNADGTLDESFGETAPGATDAWPGAHQLGTDLSRGSRRFS